MRRRILILAAAPALALLTAAPALAAAPTANYSHNGLNSFTITVGSNPSNYGMRGEEKCVIAGQDNYYYGPWVFSSGAQSTATGGCTGGGGEVTAGYFQYKESAPVRVTCWVPGDSNNGSC